MQKEEDEELRVTRLQDKDNDKYYDSRSSSAREGGNGWDGLVGSGLVPLVRSM